MSEPLLAEPQEGSAKALFRRHGVLFLALLLLVLPFVIDLLVSSRERIFGWVAADTFYYLVYAQQTLASGIVSFDGEFWSNGFHPLWLVFVLLEQILQPKAGSYIDLYFLVTISLLLQAGALVLWARVFRRSDGTVPSSFLLLIVGLYAFLISPIWLLSSVEELRRQNPWSGPEPVQGSSWAFANGLETSLLLFAFALVAWLMCRRDYLGKRRDSWLLGIALSAFILARLDHIFIAASICAFLTWEANPLRASSRRKAWLLICGIVTVVIGSYLLLNLSFFGRLLPVSGRLKSTLPWITLTNINNLVEVYGSAVGGRKPAVWVYWRVFQQLIPAVFAIAAPLFLLRFRQTSDGVQLNWAGQPRLSRFLLSVSPGVLLLASYNFLFVPAAHTGHWYYPVSILYVSLLALVLMERVRARLILVMSEAYLLRGGVSWASRGALILLSLLFFWHLHRQPEYNGRYSQFYFQEREKVRSHFSEKVPKLLSLDDGIVAYVTGFPTMSATGFALDLEAANAMSHGKLIDVANARGYNQLTSLVYVNHVALGRRRPNFKKWKRAAGGIGDLSSQDLKVSYYSKSLNFAIIEMSPTKARKGR